LIRDDLLRTQVVHKRQNGQSAVGSQTQNECPSYLLPLQQQQQHQILGEWKEQYCTEIVFNFKLTPTIRGGLCWSDWPHILTVVFDTRWHFLCFNLTFYRVLIVILIRLFPRVQTFVFCCNWRKHNTPVSVWIRALQLLERKYCFQNRTKRKSAHFCCFFGGVKLFGMFLSCNFRCCCKVNTLSRDESTICYIQ